MRTLPGKSTGQADELEESARAEKTAALKELAESRLSVLIGPAGTGKTTLLSVLCSHPKIEAGGILLLAPTGKARVRMEQSTRGLKLKGYTIAQFLSPHRYDGSTGRYRLSEQAHRGWRAHRHHRRSLDAHRGDARRADPGAQGRASTPADRRPATASADRCRAAVRRHREAAGARRASLSSFPRVGPGYAELTIRRRQAGEDREDLQLAEWFSGSPIAPGEDDVFDKVLRTGKSPHVRFVQWDTADDVRARIIEVLVEELRRPDGSRRSSDPTTSRASMRRSAASRGKRCGSSTRERVTRRAPLKPPRVGRSSLRCVRQLTVCPT